MKATGMNRSELIKKIVKASPMYDVKYLNNINDESLMRLYEWSGSSKQMVESLAKDIEKPMAKTVFAKSAAPVIKDVVEPYDPEYLKKESTKKEVVSKEEAKFLEKVKELEDAMKEEHVSFEWRGEWECFLVFKYRSGSSYPTCRYIGYSKETEDFYFGTEEDDLAFGTDVKEVVAAAKKWCGVKPKEEKVVKTRKEKVSVDLTQQHAQQLLEKVHEYTDMKNVELDTALKFVKSGGSWKHADIFRDYIRQNKPTCINADLFDVFSEKQIQAIKDCIAHGAWGDADCSFIGDSECITEWGYCTNDISKGGHYKGKEISGICSGIAKVIKKNKLNWITYKEDYWEDGETGMMFFHVERLNTTDKGLINWAKK